MNAKMGIIAVIVGFAQFAGFCAGYAGYESAINLENNCSKNVTIFCPTPYSGRAGTVRFWNVPQMDCKVNVALEQNCGDTYDTYAIYFNVRKFNLPSTDVVRIHEDGSLIKSLTGKLSASYDPVSVAQVRTHYSRRPAVTFEYQRGIRTSSEANAAFFDYVIVEWRSNSRNTYCSALFGYVNNDFICDTDGSTDRCNCPSEYSSKTDGPNPALARQTCENSRYSGSSTYSFTFTSGVIAVIAMGVLFALGLIGVICTIRRKRPSTPQINGPVVVGQYVPVRPDSDAPPPYEHVSGPGGAASYLVTPVQKF